MIAILTIVGFLLVGVAKPQELEPYRLGEFLESFFTNVAFNGTWVSDNILMYTHNSSLYFFYPETQTSELFFDRTALNGFGSYSLTLSPDRKYFLMKYNTTSIFRHSTVAQFSIIDVNTSAIYHIADSEFLSYGTWDNNGNGVAYVFENNIYYISSPLEVNNAKQITTDGVTNVIYNGVPDWVYEEEVLSSGSAMWFSPNGDKLVFAFFNDTEVGEFSYFLYGTPGDTSDIYPEEVSLRYPKVGTKNPVVLLKYVDLGNNGSEVVTLNIIPVDIVSDEYVIYKVGWATNEDIVAIIKNRVQNRAAVCRCRVTESYCYVESVIEENRGWLDLDTPVYNSEGTLRLMILAQSEGEDTYQHLILTNTSDNSAVRLTSGQRVVLSLYGWDESRNLVYYLGTTEENSAERHVFSVDVATSESICVTCGFEIPEGICTYAAVSFSKSFSYLAKVCQSSPNYAVIQSADDPSNSYLWLDNALIREQLQNKLQPTTKELNVTLESGYVTKIKLLLPPGLDETDTSTKYPMIVYVYAGPGDIRITNAFSNGFEKYITTNRKYIYAYIDGRGSSRREDSLRFQIYRRMGTVEIEDQVVATKYLRDTYSWIDSERICIWGWSYGGFATAWALVHDTEKIFNCFLSVAPVTNFIYYDTIYTERYMGLPTVDDNWIGYNNTDLTRRVESFRDRKFYVIHGSADDNVHYQNTAILMKALAEANILYSEQTYVDDAHSIASYSPHLYHSIDRYFARSFGLSDPIYN